MDDQLDNTCTNQHHCRQNEHFEVKIIENNPRNIETPESVNELNCDDDMDFAEGRFLHYSPSKTDHESELEASQPFQENNNSVNLFLQYFKDIPLFSFFVDC